MALSVSYCALTVITLTAVLATGKAQQITDDGVDKDLNPVTWQGSVTVDPGTSQKIPCGLATRAQIVNNTAFICAPRLKPNIPYTLLKLELNTLPHVENVLQPFPQNFGQREGVCDDLQSVVDIFLDPQEILWVLDNGALNALHAEPVQACFPKIIAFDAKTGKPLTVFPLNDMVTPDSRLQFICADYSDEGKPYVYVTDAGTSSVIVCDVTANDSFRVLLPKEVLPESQAKDVLYMVLVKRPDEKNLIYLTYRSSNKLFCIETKNIQKDASKAKVYEVGAKPAGIIILGTDDFDAIYMRYKEKPDIYKWNSTTPFIEKNFLLVHKNSGDLVPTHAMTDYKNGVMRCLLGNLLEYLRNGAKPPDAKNSLTVMAVTADTA